MARLQAALGILSFFIFFWLGWVRHREPFYSYFYLFAWFSYLWALDRKTLALKGRSPFSRPMEFVGLAFLSTTVWLIFEAFNFRLHNWVYSGIPHQRWIRWPGYALSFATVIPGILMTAELVQSCWALVPFPPCGGRGRMGGAVPLGMDPPTPTLPRQGGGNFFGITFVGISLAMLLLPLLHPKLFFPLVWGGFFFLLEPFVQCLGGHSLIQDWKAHRWQRTASLSAAGLLCGLFWEGCNYGAGGQWRYSLPYANFGKIFEMPFLGYLGFPAFALEIHLIREFAIGIWRQASGVQRRSILLGSLAFWLCAFAGIDHWTVVGWK